ncbi:siderophore-interacting protein [Rhodococcus triatomae]|uniref:NADPH-dependent ferric siderophore reductase, contains FAD-binding and SIP domains n=1 Tax=Rhodococcus triatomae TaxID=300028 RepID=A0A1G8Q2A2_9NOCA|nr:siderophore-interacting protein [Rhodococcus triatomae]QNG19202.1 siderophore-interacting protein [Rhodococcus triatomae]QNG24887.1 siderophore-interacting protein [Rhodococcus triatomae]SDI98847.1 NADPH-dependent ferric siderophore reductase, contains FAD-binding and SIP domains [Rhodococcus triatomae]
MSKPTATLTVLRSEQLSPHMVRVHFGDPGFDSFTPNAFTDAYVKLELPDQGQTYLRTYTIRSVDPDAREIAIDFVVHGDQGVAGPWAARARAGDTVTLRGPGGAYAPDIAADWHLLAGDETAIPAISAAAEALPAEAVGYVVLEVAGPDDEIAVSTPAGVRVIWVHRGDSSDRVGDDRAGDNAPLVEAVKALEWLPGEPHVFIHGEAQAVMHNLRPYIRREKQVPAQRASISGYWRRGRTEEGFRVWKSELAAAESTA